MVYVHPSVLCWDIPSKAKSGMHTDIVPLQASWHMLCPKAIGDETARGLLNRVKQTLKPHNSCLKK